MEWRLGMGGFIGSAAILAIAAQSVSAAATQIKNVQVTPTSGGVNIVLQTSRGDRPQVFTVSRGNALVADIVNTQLQLPQGSFSQDNPAPGISSVNVSQLDANSVRVTINGSGDAPAAQVHRGGNEIVLNVTPAGGGSSSKLSSSIHSSNHRTSPSDKYSCGTCCHSVASTWSTYNSTTCSCTIPWRCAGACSRHHH